MYCTYMLMYVYIFDVHSMCWYIFAYISMYCMYNIHIHIWIFIYIYEYSYTNMNITRTNLCWCMQTYRLSARNRADSQLEIVLLAEEVRGGVIGVSSGPVQSICWYMWMCVNIYVWHMLTHVYVWHVRGTSARNRAAGRGGAGVVR